MSSAPQPQYSCQRTDSGGSGGSEQTLIGTLQHPETGLSLASTATLRSERNGQISRLTEKLELIQSQEALQTTEKPQPAQTGKTSQSVETAEPTPCQSMGTSIDIIHKFFN
jgi:hypothetical protein